MENLVCKFNFFKPQKTQKLYVLKVFQKKKKVKVEISNFFTFELLVFEIFFVSFNFVESSICGFKNYKCSLYKIVRLSFSDFLFH